MLFNSNSYKNVPKLAQNGCNEFLLFGLKSVLITFNLDETDFSGKKGHIEHGKRQGQVTRRITYVDPISDSRTLRGLEEGLEGPCPPPLGLVMFFSPYLNVER